MVSVWYGVVCLCGMCVVWVCVYVCGTMSASYIVVVPGSGVCVYDICMWCCGCVVCVWCSERMWV